MAFAKSNHPPRYTDMDCYVEVVKYEYPNYNVADTFVISGPLGGENKPWIKGRHFHNWKEAEAYVIKTYGGYYERIRGAEPDRWCFRVGKSDHILQREGFAGVLQDTEDGRRKVYRVEI